MGEDVPPDVLGRTLAHEHVFAAFGAASGDDDLDFVDEPEILDDLRRARTDGVSTLVEVTARDMGADVDRAARLTRAAGLRLVKSTGWFRSPSIEAAIGASSGAALARRLVDDIRDGLDGGPLRAGVLGEVGLSGTAPTPAERVVLDATAEAALETGAGIVLHTDDVENATALVSELRGRGVPPERMLVGHARAGADPRRWHEELLAEGHRIGFDQLGHPRRDPPVTVAIRILELLEHGGDSGIVLSCDVGRRSRLTSRGGSGYTSGLRAVLDQLISAGVDDTVLESLWGGAAASFLALEAAA